MPNFKRREQFQAASDTGHTPGNGSTPCAARAFHRACSACGVTIGMREAPEHFAGTSAQIRRSWVPKFRGREHSQSGEWPKNNLKVGADHALRGLFTVPTAQEMLPGAWVRYRNTLQVCRRKFEATRWPNSDLEGVLGCTESTKPCWLQHQTVRRMDVLPCLQRR